MAYYLSDHCLCVCICVHVERVHTYTHTDLTALAYSEIRHCLRSAFLSSLNYSCGVWPGWNIIHQLAVSCSPFWFSFTKPVRHNPLCSLCETLHLGLFIMPSREAWACLMMTTDKQGGTVVIIRCNNWCLIICLLTFMYLHRWLHVSVGVSRCKE